jgi:hypothetical protein
MSFPVSPDRVFTVPSPPSFVGLRADRLLPGAPSLTRRESDGEAQREAGPPNRGNRPPGHVR